MKGIDTIRWLKKKIKFRGWIVSTSGDPQAGEAHLGLGADLVWGKPVPKVADVRRDLETIFARSTSGHFTDVGNFSGDDA